MEITSREGQRENKKDQTKSQWVFFPRTVAICLSEVPKIRKVNCSPRIEEKMTLILALACKDGIVMASDGQATLMSSGGPVRQRANKIKQIGQSILWAGSGDVGFLQKIEKNVNELPSELKEAEFEKLKKFFINTVHVLRKEALESSTDLYGKEKGEREATSADLLFCDYGHVARILHITPDATDEELQDFGYGASGIGDTFAYTLLRGKELHDMSCREAKVLAYRVIYEAIEVGAFGLGEPIDIWAICKSKGKNGECIKANRLSSSEIAAVRDTYLSIKEAEEEIFKTTLKP